jgi:4-hydroxy-3-methylbut-2-enyl diphosphate reductase
LTEKRDIKLAKFAGFCYGVKRAVDTVKKLKADNPDKNICVLGELIHNTQVIQELDELGIKTINELPQKGDGICVIRSHGASPEVFENIKKAGFEIVDLTCLDVKKVQQQAIELAKDDYFLVIVGKSEHPEVVAIKANAELYSDKVIVASTPDGLKPYEEAIRKHKKTGVVVQTTQRLENLLEIVKYLTPISKELRIKNTICQSTSMRHAEARELAKENDLMIVVGSKKSANTTHLAEILKDYSQTIHIENVEELANYKDIIENSKDIAITAGASTPQSVIEKVVNELKGGI